MTLKRPVTLAQARRWPAAAARRESFCARMGGMRDKLTSERTARDPRSAINRALAAWDCDKPEGLQQKHVTKGIRPMKITQKMVGAEARKNPAQKVEVLMQGKLPNGGVIRLQKRAGKFDTIINSTGYAWKYAAKGTSESDARSVYEYWMTIKNPARKAAKVKANPETWGTASTKKVRSVIARQKATGELPTFLMADTSGKRVPTPYHFGFRLNLEGENFDFVGRYSGPLLIVSEKSTGLRLPGDVPFSKRSAYGNDKEAAKSWTLDLVERVGARKLAEKVKAAR